MVLKGSLREFILADIFNLLAQQKITGKLLLSTGEKEGVIIFKEGVVVGAIKGEEQLVNKVFNLLIGAYRYPREEIQGIFRTHENNINNLFKEIVHLNLVPKDVLESYAVSVIEDIVCCFFLWIKGTYHFTSARFVDNLAALCVAISVENIIMEAMRRVDEWHRMEKLIHDDMVFVPSERIAKGSIKDVSPFQQADEFVYSKIDGISTVATIFRTSCLTEYKVYESLNTLLAAKRITPLSARISQSVVAALEKKELEEKRATTSFSTIAAILITAAIIFVALFIGKFFIHGVVFSDLTLKARLSALELPLAEALQKSTIASLQYHAFYGISSPDSDNLIKNSLLLKIDVRPLSEMDALKKTPRKEKI
ncbi:MAG: DUF4388 domain-containing protein [Chitinispirillaceae bacterium]|nr:DUF4388 domain-containing protein [Chitinispirillaceae bacterium]